MAAYDLNVRGGFGVVEPGWNKVFHQSDTIKLEQMKAGSLLVRGGLCGKRLQNSKAVKVEGSSRIRARGQGGPPDVRLSDGVDVIDSVVFDTREECKHGS